MKQKPKILKPRIFIPLIALLLFYIGCGIYVMQVSKVNSIYFLSAEKSMVKGSLQATSSNENAVKIKHVSETSYDKDDCLLTVQAENAGVGDAVVHITFDMQQTDMEGQTEQVAFDEELYATPFGTLYNKTEDHFDGAEVIILATVVTMFVVAAAMIASLVEKQRNGDFSYSLVARGGLTVFCSVIPVIILIEWIQSDPYWGIYSISYIAILLFESAQTFVMISMVPLGLLSLALSLSNIQLVRHEGFRPLNLLGVFLGLVMMGGIAIWYWLNQMPFFDSIDSLFVSLYIAIAFAFIYCYFECMLLSTILCATLCTRYKPPYDMDYIIILGCAIRKDGTPTPLLRGRVDRALQFEREQFAKTGKHAKFVPSGGQGSDEIISEAESMKRYLVEQGVPKEQIVKESKSVNTYQNMLFSKQVIENDAKSEDVSIGFSTTNYHVFRGYTLARRFKMKVKGLSAKTKLYFFPNAFIREFIGLVWEQKFRHLLFVFLLTISLGILYFLVIV